MMLLATSFGNKIVNKGFFPSIYYLVFKTSLGSASNKDYVKEDKFENLKSIQFLVLVCHLEPFFAFRTD